MREIFIEHIQLPELHENDDQAPATKTSGHFTKLTTFTPDRGSENHAQGRFEAETKFIFKGNKHNLAMLSWMEVIYAWMRKQTQGADFAPELYLVKNEEGKVLGVASKVIPNFVDLSADRPNLPGAPEGQNHPVLEHLEQIGCPIHFRDENFLSGPENQFRFDWHSFAAHKRGDMFNHNDDPHAGNDGGEVIFLDEDGQRVNINKVDDNGDLVPDLEAINRITDWKLRFASFDNDMSYYGSIYAATKKGARVYDLFSTTERFSLTPERNRDFPHFKGAKPYHWCTEYTLMTKHPENRYTKAQRLFFKSLKDRTKGLTGNKSDPMHAAYQSDREKHYKYYDYLACLQHLTMDETLLRWGMESAVGAGNNIPPEVQEYIAMTMREFNRNQANDKAALLATPEFLDAVTRFGHNEYWHIITAQIQDFANRYVAEDKRQAYINRACHNLQTIIREAKYIKEHYPHDNPLTITLRTDTAVDVTYAPDADRLNISDSPDYQLDPTDVRSERNTFRFDETLLAHRRYINRRGENGETPLGIAIQQTSIDVVRALVDAGANIRKKTGTGDQAKSPIVLAVEEGKFPVFAYLHSKGARLSESELTTVINKLIQPKSQANDLNYFMHFDILTFLIKTYPNSQTVLGLRRYVAENLSPYIATTFHKLYACLFGVEANLSSDEKKEVLMLLHTSGALYTAYELLKPNANGRANLQITDEDREAFAATLHASADDKLNELNEKCRNPNSVICQNLYAKEYQPDKPSIAMDKAANRQVIDWMLRDYAQIPLAENRAPVNERALHKFICLNKGMPTDSVAWDEITLDNLPRLYVNALINRNSTISLLALFTRHRELGDGDDNAKRIRAETTLVDSLVPALMKVRDNPNLTLLQQKRLAAQMFKATIALVTEPTQIKRLAEIANDDRFLFIRKLRTKRFLRKRSAGDKKGYGRTGHSKAIQAMIEERAKLIDRKLAREHRDKVRNGEVLTEEESQRYNTSSREAVNTEYQRIFSGLSLTERLYGFFTTKAKIKLAEENKLHQSYKNYIEAPNDEAEAPSIKTVTLAAPAG